jgi:shikimate dehydrogenase
MTTRLAVLGSPIAHSKSPALQRAAYGVLGLDWQYDAIEVTAARLPEFVAGLGPDWRGLSLTMPLKKDVLPLLDQQAPLVGISGAANTVLFDQGLHGFNTDVAGIIGALQPRIPQVGDTVILGGGATAASALLAVAELGCRSVYIVVRDLSRSADLVALAAAQPFTVDVMQLDDILDTGNPPALGEPDLIISTLPGGADTGITFHESMRHEAILFDVAYDPWPSALATEWLAVGGTVVSGLEMLAWQALAQVRVFVNGDPDAVLHNEDAVWAAMRASVGLR